MQKQCQAVVAYLLKGREVGINDMHITNGDNFGMVLKGEEASYVQRILFQNIILRSLRLGKLKIHSENPAERLSRRPTNDWLSLCHEDLTELDWRRRQLE